MNCFRLFVVALSLGLSPFFAGCGGGSGDGPEGAGPEGAPITEAPEGAEDKGGTAPQADTPDDLVD